MFSIHAQALLKEQSCQTSSSGNIDGSLFVTKHRVLFVCKLIVCFTLAINLIICLSFAVLCFARKTTPPPPIFFLHRMCRAWYDSLFHVLHFQRKVEVSNMHTVPFVLYISSEEEDLRREAPGLCPGRYGRDPGVGLTSIGSTSLNRPSADWK